jgi:hypothetical protein
MNFSVACHNCEMKSFRKEIALLSLKKNKSLERIRRVGRFYDNEKKLVS